MIANCERCGKLCQTGISKNKDIWLLKKSETPKGYCANCAITEFIKNNEVLNDILERKGPEQLLDPRSIAQFGRVLQAGNSDADLKDIDWKIVVKNWNLPFKKKRGKRN